MHPLTYTYSQHNILNNFFRLKVNFEAKWAVFLHPQKEGKTKKLSKFLIIPIPLSYTFQAIWCLKLSITGINQNIALEFIVHFFNYFHHLIKSSQYDYIFPSIWEFFLIKICPAT